MPTLEDLFAPGAAEQFAQSVAHNAIAFRKDTVDVNGGIRTTAELNERIAKGRSVEFDYQRMVDESKSYR
jgi:phosphoribosylformimino-5-aminoimidazole carboxamide ribonucleotide (ProFAR) isomerase